MLARGDLQNKHIDLPSQHLVLFLQGFPTPLLRSKLQGQSELGTCDLRRGVGTRNPNWLLLSQLHWKDFCRVLFPPRIARRLSPLTCILFSSFNITDLVFHGFVFDAEAIQRAIPVQPIH